MYPPPTSFISQLIRKSKPLDHTFHFLRSISALPSAMAAPPVPSAPHVHIEAVQTVTPMKAIEPAGQSRRIASAGPLSAAALAGHLRLVLYYKRAREVDSGWAVAGWLKESLNAALSEEPLLAGRLRRSDDGEGLEVRLNDAGVRLVQAQAEVAMAEFLAAEDREKKEAHLAHWVDIDRGNPQFSAMFYVQVTSFQDDGYSIGLCCSLLLADPLFISGFLRRWAHIHTNLQAQNKLSNLSIFYLGNFQRAGGAAYLTSTPMDPVPGYADRTVLFDHPADAANAHVVAAACLEEAAAAQKMEEKRKEASEFSLITAGIDRLAELKVDESCVMERPSMSNGSPMKALDVDNWGRLHCDELSFGEGNKPVRVSYKVVAGGDRPLVVVMPPLEEGGRGLIGVTFP